MNIFNEGYRASVHVILRKKEIDNPYNPISEKEKFDEWSEGFNIGLIEEKELYDQLKNTYEF